MADDFGNNLDRAFEHQQAAIAAARERAKSAPVQATGRCLNCGGDLPDGLRYCDAECRDDHAYRTNTKRRTTGGND